MCRSDCNRFILISLKLIKNYSSGKPGEEIAGLLSAVGKMKSAAKAGAGDKKRLLELAAVDFDKAAARRDSAPEISAFAYAGAAFVRELLSDGEACRLNMMSAAGIIPVLSLCEAPLSMAEKIVAAGEETAENGPVSLTIERGVSISMVNIPAGIFMMGSPAGELSRQEEEAVHTVEITAPFRLGISPVTQAQWKAVTGCSPSFFRGKDCLPVERISWLEAMEFCRELNRRTRGCRPPGYEYSLPTEAEWEYACRAGTSSEFHYGSMLNSSMANFNGAYPYNAGTGIYREKTSVAGSFFANAFGLYDMHGNVREWCRDWDGDYCPGVCTDPCGPEDGHKKILRGGCWNDRAEDCRSASRDSESPEYKDSHTGFRLALSRIR